MAHDALGRHISKRRTKKNFTTIGLCLTLYVLLAMILPYIFNWYMIETNSSILKDDFLYYGIYFIFMLFGTIIPFFFMRKFARVKFRRIFRVANASFSDLFVQTIVLFALCIASTYISSTIVSNFGLQGKLISSIGFNYEDKNLVNNLYLFMLIVVSPILEEYAFRGVLLTTLGRYGRKFALIASSIVFALAHNNFAEMIPAFAMGYILGKLSLRYRSIQPTIVIHILFNAFIYGLCVLPTSITKYMAYGLVAICILTIYLVLTGKYQFIKVQNSSSNKVVSSIFYSNFWIVFAMMMMVGYTLLFTFVI